MGCRQLWAGLGGAILMACGGDSGGPTPPPPPPPPPAATTCSSVTPVQLSVGEHQVIDPAGTSGCVRVPAAGASGAEYAVVIAATTGIRSSAGVSGAYFVRTSNPAASVVAGAPPAAPVASTPTLGVGGKGFPVEPRLGRGPVPAAFDRMLREREAALAADPANRSRPPSGPERAPAAGPPAVGDVRTFKTCKNVTCSAFDSVAATARFVGTKAAIYMDNNVPTADTLRDVDYQDLGRTFDTYHYPIDRAAFGAESDLDQNDRIIILMTKSVNNLTPDCTNGRVLGYFFGLDLITTGAQAVNSNKGEIFYTFVPAPATATCTATSRSQAIGAIKPTLIHELQHMISWNQRVILGSGQAEETWLNEAMSHFAEELGGRQIPNAECVGFNSCRSQYISGDIINTYDYLKDTESNFLIYPISSNGTLEERGASWNFLRWVIDQFATDTLLGGDLTPRLVTGPGGAGTFNALTGQSFSTLVTEWLLAAYLDDRPGFTPLSDRLRFKSWGLRAIYENPLNASIFPTGFPLRPDSTSGAYTRSGTLRGGSGRHFRLIQAANGAAIDFQVLKDSAGNGLDPALVARIGIARVR